MKKSLLMVFCSLIIGVSSVPATATEWLGSWSEGYRTVLLGQRVQIGTGPTVLLPLQQYGEKWCVKKAYFIAKAFAEKYEGRGEVFILLNLVDVDISRESHAQAVFLEGGVYWPLGHLSPPQDGVFETRGTLCGITNFECGDWDDDKLIFIRITSQTRGKEVMEKLLSLNLFGVPDNLDYNF